MVISHLFVPFSHYIYPGLKCGAVRVLRASVAHQRSVQEKYGELSRSDVRDDLSLCSSRDPDKF